MSNKVSKLLFVVAMLVGVAAPGPLRAENWQDQAPVSPHPLDGWRTLKFGMTPGQVCDAMNKADLKCTVMQNKSLGTGDSRVSIGNTTWSVDPYFANQHLDPVTHMVIGGNLNRIVLKLCHFKKGVLPGESCQSTRITHCDAESIIGLLEGKYGPFARNPANPVSALKRFANGANVSVYTRIIGDNICAPVNIDYFNPNVEARRFLGTLKE